MAVSDIIQKMRGANMPRFVYETTLPKAGFPSLREIVAKKEYKTEGGYRSYVLAPPSEIRTTTTPRAAALMGKELLLSGVPVYYQPIAGFLREVRLQDYAATRDPMSPILDFIGTGYLVLVDFDNEACRSNSAVWQEGQELLQAHVHRGGGLILSCEKPIDYDFGGYNMVFHDMLESMTHITLV